MTDGEPRVLVRRLMEGPGLIIWLWCPGCAELHQVQVADDEGAVPTGPVWEWNRDADFPTITPSILVQGGRNGSAHVCHSFVTEGVWNFLDDCTHSLAGQQFVMTGMPSWMSK